MFKNLSKGTKIVLIIAAAFVAFVVLPFISWIVTDEGITATSDATFCVGCHSITGGLAAGAGWMTLLTKQPERYRR